MLLKYKRMAELENGRNLLFQYAKRLGELAQDCDQTEALMLEATALKLMLDRDKLAIAIERLRTSNDPSLLVHV